MIDTDTLFRFTPAGSSGQVHCVSDITPNFHASADAVAAMITVNSIAITILNNTDLFIDVLPL
jgi:hypothetical protein